MKGKMTVSHAKFQYYRHNYCLVCMTGLLGCRWHRYQQSTRENRKRDVFWFSLFVLTFLFITFYFYFWLISEDGYNDMEWYMFEHLRVWVPWYRIFLSLTSAAFGYFLLVMILYMCHIGHGHQIFIHMAHLVLIVLSFVGCVVVTVLIDELWNTQFDIVYLSLQMFGPFLHIGVVSIITALMWFISHSWYKLSNKWWQLFWLVVMMGGMVGLYIAPLYIHCPCVTDTSPTPTIPRFFAHRGAEAVAPENTMIAFQKAVDYGAWGLESDVRISYDGVPFIHHDDTFLRTTNIEDVFPDRVNHDVSLFNISDIKRLNAGTWFFDKDPHYTAGSVSEKDREVYTNQSIPLLTDLLNISAANGKMVMFDVREPVAGNPFQLSSNEVVNDTLLNSGFDMSKLYWLVQGEGLEPVPPGAVAVFPGAPSVSRLNFLNISTVNVRYSGIDAERIRWYNANNISTSVYVVDSHWLLSYFWCVATPSITTSRIDQLAGLAEPVLTLAENSYLILWVSVDILSAVVVIIIFVVQRIRLFGTSFTPESVSLTSARRARNYRSRTMKEKLLREGVIDPMDDPESQGSSGVINHPVAYSMASLPASASFSGVASPSSGHGVPPVTTQPDRKYEVE